MEFNHEMFTLKSLLANHEFAIILQVDLNDFWSKLGKWRSF